MEELQGDGIQIIGMLPALGFLRLRAVRTIHEILLIRWVSNATLPFSTWSYAKGSTP